MSDNPTIVRYPEPYRRETLPAVNIKPRPYRKEKFGLVKKSGHLPKPDMTSSKRRGKPAHKYHQNKGQG